MGGSTVWLIIKENEITIENEIASQSREKLVNEKNSNASEVDCTVDSGFKPKI